MWFNTNSVFIKFLILKYIHIVYVFYVLQYAHLKLCFKKWSKPIKFTQNVIWCRQKINNVKKIFWSATNH